MIHLIGFHQLVFNKYHGSTLAVDLMRNLNDGLYDVMQGNCEFNIEHTYVENQLNMDSIELRSVDDRY